MLFDLLPHEGSWRMRLVGRPVAMHLTHRAPCCVWLRATTFFQPQLTATTCASVCCVPMPCMHCSRRMPSSMSCRLHACCLHTNSTIGFLQARQEWEAILVRWCIFRRHDTDQHVFKMLSILDTEHQVGWLNSGVTHDRILAHTSCIARCCPLTASPLHSVHCR